MKPVVIAVISRLLLSGVLLTAAESAFAQTRGRALLVGIETYKDSRVRSTAGGVDDAAAFSRLIVEKGWFQPGEIRTLIGPAATAAGIKQNFEEWLIGQTSPGDRVLFFYSGHGTQINDDNGDEAGSVAGDTYDEAIAPYDVILGGKSLGNTIRDDQFNQWLGDLGGRSVVMIFDSCHSGTVSRGVGTRGYSQQNQLFPRYLPGPDQWPPTPPPSAQSRTLIDGAGYSVSDGQDTGPASRDLKIFYDRKRTRANYSLVVFSASGSHQVAWPMHTPGGRIRGALSYYLENELRSGNSPIGQICSNLTTSIDRAHRQGLLNGDQIPYCEMSTPSIMSAQPLFGAASRPETLPLHPVSQANLASALRVSARVGVDRNQQITFSGSSFCIGSRIGYQIETSAPGYLYIFVFSHDDVATIIHPAAGEEKLVNAGTTRLINFPVTEPAGRDIIAVILTRDPLSIPKGYLFSNNHTPTLTWKVALGLLGEPSFSQTINSRGQGGSQQPPLKPITLATTDWQAAIIEAEAIHCSNINDKG